MQKDKIGIWDQFVISCSKPKKYRQLLSVSAGKFILFVLITGFLLMFLSFGMSVLSFGASVGGPRNFVLNRLPKFQLEKGKMNIKTPMEFDIGTSHFVLDSRKKTVSDSDFDDQYDAEFYVVEDELVMRNTVSGAVRIRYADYPDLSMNNDSLVGLLPIFYMMIVMMSVVVLITSLLSCLFYAALIGIMIRMNLKVLHEDVPFRQTFHLAFYASVPFRLAGALGSSMGFAFFDGMAWYLIMCFGTYELLFYALRDPKNPGVPRS